ncbi:MAG TPA: class I SAM-dependent methyltransferase [Streptosporangiaceae bacterium]|jgi:SAM-dependent methyltransferase
MNEEHLRICSSPEWAEYVRDELVPWALAGDELGDDVLEIGPGPGLTTDALRGRVARLTAVEIDDHLARELSGRLAGTNVEVVRGDGTRLPFEEGRFSGAVMFTMLHHVPSADLQDQLLGEVRRVLRPGGLLAGTDSPETPARRELHEGDIYLPVDPAALADRLLAAGFATAIVEEGEQSFRFRATTIG